MFDNFDLQVRRRKANPTFKEFKEYLCLSGQIEFIFKGNTKEDVIELVKYKLDCYPLGRMVCDLRLDLKGICPTGRIIYKTSNYNSYLENQKMFVIEIIGGDNDFVFDYVLNFLSKFDVDGIELDVSIIEKKVKKDEWMSWSNIRDKEFNREGME